MIKRFKIVSKFLLLLLSINACSNKEEADKVEKFFVFDTKNIGIDVTDSELGIVFHPPLNWELTPSSLSKKLETNNGRDEGFTYTPTYLFFDKSNGSILSVGKVIPNDSTQNKAASINYYKSVLLQKYKSLQTGYSSFVHSKIQFNLFRLQKENLLSYKLFFLNSKLDLIQFDYTIPKALSDSTNYSIKASVGSIREL